jgi:hypothetical protein
VYENGADEHEETKADGQGGKTHGNGLNAVCTNGNQICVIDTARCTYQSAPAIVAVNGKVLTGFHRSYPCVIKMTVHEISIPEPAVVTQVQQILRTLPHGGGGN